MTATDSRPAAPSITPSTRPFLLGAAGFVLVGAGHLVFSAAAALADRTPQQEATDAVMRDATVTLLGLERSTLEVFHGFSIAMALFAIACGLLALTAVRLAPELARRRNAFGWTALATSLGGLAVAVLLLPPPPIVVLTLTSGAFAWSLHRAAR
ncbi:LIC_13387 family protein [Streptomyces sparsus]